MVKKAYLKWLLLPAGVFAGIQFVPVDRTNPAVEESFAGPPEVQSILERSCYDCHSNETRWPWYSRLAPASWLLAKDVREAREHLNFSTWNRYDEGSRQHLIEEIGEEVEEGNMPLWFYLPLHPSARLATEDLSAISAWVAAAAPPGSAHSATSVAGHEHAPAGAGEAVAVSSEGLE